MTTPLRAILLRGVSSEEQARDDKSSLQSQLDAATAFCKAQGYTIIDDLVVDGFSRDYDEFEECARDMELSGRPAFRRLEQHWKNRDFDLLICRDGDRFARTLPLYAFIVNRTIKSNARLYFTAQGMFIDENNYIAMSAFGGYRAASDIARIIAGSKAGMENRVTLGRSQNSLCYSHRRIRDERGKEIGLAIIEELMPLWNYVASLLLDGESWQSITQHVAEKGFRRPSGQQFSRPFFRLTLLNPYFWGHSARYYAHKEGIWAFDESEPLPAGVLVRRNTHQPVWAADDPLTIKIKAELRRRARSSDIIVGRASPSKTNRYTGLLRCSTCGYSLARTFPSKDQTRAYYRCVNRYNGKIVRPNICTDTNYISAKDVDEYFHLLLEQLIQGVELFNLDSSPNGEYERQKALKIKFEQRLNNLIFEQSDAPINTRSFYQSQINTVAVQLEEVDLTLSKLRRNIESPSHVKDRAIAIAQVRELSLSVFWELPSTQINQYLHRIFGNYRVVVKSGRIIRIAYSPSKMGRPKLS